MRTVLFAVTAVLTALGCEAVTFPFDVKAPVWNKVAVCTAEEGINIRKAPSTSAQRMVYNEAKIEDYETPLTCLGYWASKTGGNIKPVLFNDMAPVVAEQPGWVELLNIGPEGPQGPSNGWVSAKYCKISEITPITASTKPTKPYFMILNTGSGIEGEYGMYFTGDDMNGLATFYIGRIADGKLVCPYAFTCDYYDASYDDSKDATTISEEKNSETGYKLTLTRQGTSAVMEEYGPAYYMDLSKLSAHMLNYIINQAKPLDKYTTTVYLYDNSYHEIY